MKIMLDTNVLISAFVFGGKAGQLLQELFESEHYIYVSEYVDKEFKDKLEMKWSAKAEKVYSLYRTLDFVFCRSTEEELGIVRDKKDIPVLSDALYNDVDVLVTGDKDFLESDIKKPIILSPTLLYEFLNK